MRSNNRQWLLFLLLCFVLGTAGCQFRDKLKAREHLNQGVQAYIAKKYDEAVGEFKSAIELDPKLVDAYLYLATAYRAQFVPMALSPENLKRGQQAIATYEQVLEIDPGNTTAMAHIADIHRNMNEPEKAKEWYRNLMAANYDKAEALYGIASIDYNLAADKTGIDGENVENLTEEEIAEVSAAVDEAIDCLKQALELRRDYTDAMQYLNLAYREKAELAGEDEEARSLLLKEADKLALEAVAKRRQQQRDAERERRKVFSSAEESEKQ
jgi:tetratricopeptide (TPR) repeat protein